MGLIIPKNNADPKTLDLTLQVYYDADDWVQNSQLIQRLSTMLQQEGIEEIEKEPQSYTKKTQVLSYYGFIEWEDPTNNQSRRRITANGKKLYEYRKSNDISSIQSLLLEVLNTNTFGRNVLGCDSDSDLEAPNIFLKSTLLLQDLTNKEFAYILGEMEYKKRDLADAIFNVSLMRKKGVTVLPDSASAKWADPKPILALADWGIFEISKKANSKFYNINKDVLENHSSELMSLRIKNTDPVLFKSYNDMEEKSNNSNVQQIFYGAPGTGKSHEISLTTTKDNSIRTTFHPDSDYSSFVGAYKPIEEIRPRYGLNQKETVRMIDEEKNPLNEKIITYNFVPQAFIKAYTEAWYRYAKWQNEEGEKEAAPKTYYLIIEEINRGNCAQIFGDLFQLLDREGNGFSSYAISPDNDIQLYLGGTEFSIKEKKWGLKGIDLKGIFYNDEKNVIASAEEIISGELMLLPPNLFIWATMNTSDQSLFPIDSAFKRRWDWKYMPINKPDGKDHKIRINENEYDWWDFIRSINEVIYSTTRSEDKKLGYFFCKAKENIISADALASKAFFYLWNDVFRDYGFKNDIFKRDENKRFVFQDFFLPDGKINEPVAEQFVKQVIARLNPETPTITE